jgi:integrase
MMRALFTFAEDEYEKPNGDSLISANPVRRLSRQRAWYELQPRKTYVKDEQLEAWWRAVEKMHSDVPRACYDQNKDYLRLILFTGLRLDEAAGLRCEDVDMKVKVFIVRDPKNGRDHALPITDYLYQLFSRRLANARALGSPFVFPGPGKSGHMGGAKDFVHKVCEEAEIKFTLHDLRRTFATMAHGLEVRTYSIKRLLNHKMKGDVTFEHYLIIEAETLRVPMQKITDRILKLVGERKSAKVVKMPRAHTKAA